jgi:hypothetical protein
MKNIDFGTTGSVTSTLVFTNEISPDVYFFRAQVGEQIRLETSNASFDPTIRVVGPDAAVNLFNDDAAPPNRNSRLVFTAADTGSYIAIVSSFDGNAPGGNYTLNFARGTAVVQPVSEVSEDTERGKSSRASLENPVEVKK